MRKKNTRGAKTLADIARLASVSASTVSRALNDSPLINVHTKARIRDIARRQGYTVNVRARDLRLKQSRTVAVLVPLTPRVHAQMSDLFFLDLLGSIADTLASKGYDMLLSSAQTETDWHAGLLRSGRADGIIAIGQATHDEHINQVAASGAPIVVWGALLPEQRYCTVGSDNRHGAYEATRHLLRLGRRRIAFLGDATLPEICDRHDGYLAALGEAGLTQDAGLQIPVAFDAAAAARAIGRRLQRRGNRFDAVFAASDELAISVIRLLGSRGLRVPQDVAVVGYDDIRLAEYVHPALTTVRQNIGEGGRLLTLKLLEMFAGRSPASVVLPTELIVRESCGGGRTTLAEPR